MWDVATPLTMSQEQLLQLKAWVRAPSTPQKIVLRSRFVYWPEKVDPIDKSPKNSSRSWSAWYRARAAT
jgi:hypothetical protein